LTYLEQKWVTKIFKTIQNLEIDYEINRKENLRPEVMFYLMLNFYKDVTLKSGTKDNIFQIPQKIGNFHSRLASNYQRLSWNNLRFGKQYEKFIS